MADVLLHVDDAPAGIGLIPAPIKGLSRQPELYDQIAGEVLRLDLAALLPPQPDQGSLVLAHDGPGVGAAEVMLPISLSAFPQLRLHGFHRHQTLSYINLAALLVPYVTI